MSEAGVWVVIALLGVVTYASRLSFLAFFSNRDVPPRVRRALRFVPPAVLTALIIPDLAYRGGVVDLTHPRVFAALLAGVVAWRTKNVLWTTVAGMAALLAIQAWFPAA